MIFLDHHNIHDFSEWNTFAVIVVTACLIIGFYVKYLQSKQDD